MRYPTLMVHLELDRPNAGLLAMAGDLAGRLHSRVIGVATAQPIVFSYDDGYIAGVVIEQNKRELDQKMSALEAEFRAAFLKRNTATEWRSDISYGPHVDYVAAEARCADLILIRSPGKHDPNKPGIVDAGALIMQAGRPVLVVPSAAKAVQLGKAIVCWTDTREARRAVSNSIGLLKLASAVDIVEVTTENGMEACRSRLQDVVLWLGLHGIKADFLALPDGGDENVTLASVVEDRDADFVVAGAYGHTRMHEWVLGGVTRGLWMHSDRCCLLSH